MSDESNETKSGDMELGATKTKDSQDRPAEEDGGIQQVEEGSAEPENNEAASKENKEGEKEKEKGGEITAGGVAVVLMGGDEKEKKKRRKQLFSCLRRVTKEIADDEDGGDCFCGLFSSNDD